MSRRPFISPVRTSPLGALLAFVLWFGWTQLPGQVSDTAPPFTDDYLTRTWAIKGGLRGKEANTSITSFAQDRAGAIGYLLKRPLPAELLRAIEQVHAGGAPMWPHIARLVMAFFRGGPRTPANDVDNPRPDPHRSRPEIAAPIKPHFSGIT